MERNENGLSSLFPRVGTDSGYGGNCSDSSYSGEEYIGRGSGYTSRGGCAGNCAGTNGRQLAMVYSPMQCWRMLHGHDEALMKGTLFEELYKPLVEEW